MKGNALSVMTMDLIESIDQSRSIDALYDVVSRFRGLFDVEHAVYHSVSRDGQPYALATYGREWSKHYENNRLYLIDPVVRAAFSRFGIYDWSHLSWDGAKLSNFRNEAIEGGVGNQGLSMPIRGPEGEFALVTVSDMSGDDAWLGKRDRIKPYMVMLGHYLHETTRAMSIQEPYDDVWLSPRERDVLLFLSQGLNRASIADRLTISEHTLRVYVDAARRKLGAQNTTHAVARALHRGLIAL